MSIKGAVCVLALMATGAAQAHMMGNMPTPWTVRIGGTDIAPKQDNGTLGGGNVDVMSKLGMSFNVDYRLCRYVSFDLLGVIPYVQHIKIDGSDIASTKHLPPTLSVQLHPLQFEGAWARIDPYVGVGVNRTFFFSEHVANGAHLQLSNTWGVAAQVGVDANLTSRWLVGADVRYIQIEPDASINGAALGTVKINPFVYSLNVGYRF